MPEFELLLQAASATAPAAAAEPSRNVRRRTADADASSVMWCPFMPVCATQACEGADIGGLCREARCGNNGSASKSAAGSDLVAMS